MKKYVLILGLLASFSAKSAIIASGDDCGENCHWEIDDETHTLRITGSGKIKDYASQTITGMGIVTAAPWIEYRQEVETLTISDGITEIGSNAFRTMRFLENVNLPEGLTKIGYASMMSLPNLKHIDLPSSVTDIGDVAFQDDGLEDIELPSKIQSIGWGSFSNTKISNVVLPDTIKNLNNNAFGDDTYLNGYYNKIPLETLYCPEHLMTQCENMVFFRANLGKATDIISYQKTSDGQIFCNNKWYDNANDILKGDHIKKRIYTVEEASRLSKPTGNIFKLRYK